MKTRELLAAVGKRAEFRISYKSTIVGTIKEVYASGRIVMESAPNCEWVGFAESIERVIDDGE
jgi:hypothetical protein